LKKVNSELPADVIGRDAVQEANNIIDRKYDEVLSKIKFSMTSDTYSDAVKAVNKAGLNPSQRAEVVSKLDNIVLQNFRTSARIDGQTYKGIESDLRKEALSYKNSATKAERDIGDTLFDVLETMKKNLRRQNPEQTSALRRVDNAYGDIAVMRTAAANSGAANGVFTPKQYSTAVRQRDSSRNKTAFAAGQARGQELSDAALEKLGEDATQYQTGRQVVQGFGLGAALSSPPAALAAVVAAPVLYSEGGLRAMQVLLRSRPDAVREVGKILEKRASKEGSITGAQVLAEYNRLTRTEEE
jgi:hypothetical protein